MTSWVSTERSARAAYLCWDAVETCVKAGFMGKLKKSSAMGARLFWNILILEACKRHQTGTETHIRSEEHTSELQSLMRISYAVFCLKKKNKKSKIYLTVETTEKYTNLDK